MPNCHILFAEIAKWMTKYDKTKLKQIWKMPTIMCTKPSQSAFICLLSCHVLSCLVLSCNISEFICIENLVKDAVIKSTHRYWFPDWWIYFFAQFGLQNGRSSKQMINLHKSWSWTAKIIFTQRCIRIQGDCAKSECPFCNGLLYT